MSIEQDDASCAVENIRAVSKKSYGWHDRYGMRLMTIESDKPQASVIKLFQCSTESCDKVEYPDLANLKDVQCV